MAFKTTVKIEGLAELEKALLEMSTATARNVMRRALTKAAEPIAEEARRLAPFRAGNLKKGIRVWTKAVNNVGKAEFRSVLRDGGSTEEAVAAMRAARREARAAGSKAPTVEVWVAPTNVPQATLQEFGTVNNDAQPFMRPAWDKHRDGTFEAIKTEMKTEISKAAARAARKALRQKAGK
jgi:HK97 gp10 family phage protein